MQNITTEQKAKLFDDIMDFYDTDCSDTENKEVYREIITGIRLAQIGLHGYLTEQGRDDTWGDITLTETTILRYKSTKDILFGKNKGK